MSVQNIYNIAKSIQPFIKGGGEITNEGIYHLIMTNYNLSFIKQMFSIENIPVLVFVAREIAVGNDDPSIIGEIKNNLFYFNIFEFGDTENDIDCNQCGGEGRIDCYDCDGSGDIYCDACDGDGQDAEGYTCEDCGGDGNITCSRCDGNGREECYECSGNGSMTVYNEIPYDLSYCVSYDKGLKTDLEQTILRNEPIYINPTQNDKTLILKVDMIGVGENSNTEEISKEYANDNYGGITLFPDEVNLKYIGSKIYIGELDMSPEKFF